MVPRRVPFSTRAPYRHRMPLHPHIRLAKPADATTLAELGARTFADAFGTDNTRDDLDAFLRSTYTPAIQARELADPSLTYLIAESAEQVPMAFALLNRASVAPQGVSAPASWELQRFYVDRAWHGSGAAAPLMDACCSEARSARVTGLWLGVWERNARAIRFYEKMGFHRVGTKIFVVGSDPQSDVVMMRTIECADA
jgi:diamine N-acetyltransferase